MDGAQSIASACEMKFRERGNHMFLFTYFYIERKCSGVRGHYMSLYVCMWIEWVAVYVAKCIQCSWY